MIPPTGFAIAYYASLLDNVSLGLLCLAVCVIVVLFINEGKS